VLSFFAFVNYHPRTKNVQMFKAILIKYIYQQHGGCMQCLVFRSMALSNEPLKLRM
jgi:hypothetical protein